MPSIPAQLRRALLTGTVAALALTLPALGSSPAQAAGSSSLAKKLATVMKDPRVQRADSGAVVLNASTGKLLYSRRGDQGLIPASNTKVVTAVAALHTLGPNYRFSTEVLRRGAVVGGTLQGRLYLKGYGDPTLRQSDLKALAEQVRSSGISRVSGKLFVDPTFFDAQTYNPGWSTSYAADYYAAPVSGLTLAPDADYDSGTVIINDAPGSTGAKAQISTTPAAAKDYVKIKNLTTTGARGTSNTFSADRAYGSSTITVRGRVPRGGATGHTLITVDRPELYVAAVFRAELKKAGVTVVGGTTAGATPAGHQYRIGRDTSMTLAHLLVPFLKLSNNLHAEALTKAMGALTGRPGSWKDGLAYTTAYLTSLGVPMAGVSLTDGSGLTRRNHLTPLALATTLQKVQSEDWFGSFYAALPVAGDSRRLVGGTMRYRLTGTKAALNAHAKTGSLTGVTALSGYVRGADKTLYVYSMVSNYTHETPRPLENSMVVTLADWR